MSLQFQVHYDDPHLMEGHKRRRTVERARTGSSYMRVIGLLASVVLIVLAALNERWFFVLLLVLLAIFIIVADLIDEMTFKNWIENSPFRGDTILITLDENGVMARGPKSDVIFGWEAFTRVVRFPDGFLLYQGPKVWIWLPQRTLQEGTLQYVGDLLREKIADYSSRVPEN
jgi:hypothetical protein